MGTKSILAISLIAVLLIGVISFDDAFAQVPTITWDGGGGDDLWSNPLNWDTDQVPTGLDGNIIIDGNVVVNLDHVTTFQLSNQLTINEDAELIVGSNTQIITRTGATQTGSIINHGILTIQGSITLSGIDSLPAIIDNFGTINNFHIFSENNEHTVFTNHPGAIINNNPKNPFSGFGSAGLFENKLGAIINNDFEAELTFVGNLINRGTIHNDGDIKFFASDTDEFVFNFGTINNNPGATLTNTSFFTNFDTINNDIDATIINTLTFNNSGLINNDGTIFNDSYDLVPAHAPTINNKSTINNNVNANIINDVNANIINDGIINNSIGTITNSGTIDNLIGATIENSGTIDNTLGAIGNAGTINNDCGGQIIGNPISENPPVDVCDSDGDGEGGCLIATAAYGSHLAPEVQMLREIRDNMLMQTESGSAFMSGFNQFYYSFSPTIAEWEHQNPAFKEVVRTTITPLITSLSILNYVSMDSEAEVITFGISIILLNIGMYFVAPAIIIHRIKKFV